MSTTDLFRNFNVSYVCQFSGRDEVMVSGYELFILEFTIDFSWDSGVMRNTESIHTYIYIYIYIHACIHILEGPSIYKK